MWRATSWKSIANQKLQGIFHSWLGYLILSHHRSLHRMKTKSFSATSPGANPITWCRNTTSGVIQTSQNLLHTTEASKILKAPLCQTVTSPFSLSFSDVQLFWISSLLALLCEMPDWLLPPNSLQLPAPLRTRTHRSMFPAVVWVCLFGSHKRSLLLRLEWLISVRCHYPVFKHHLPPCNNARAACIFNAQTSWSIQSYWRSLRPG